MIINGLTLEQYAKFNTDAQNLAKEWEANKTDVDIQPRMEKIYLHYNQDINILLDEGYYSFSSAGLIPEWHNFLFENPDFMVKFTTLQSKYMTNVIFGDAESSTLSFAGISLEKYAQGCALLKNSTEENYKNILMSIGITDITKWNDAKEKFNRAMEKDTSFKLTTHFGQLYAKYGNQHIDDGLQFSKDLLEQNNEERDDREELERITIREIMQFAIDGKNIKIIDHIRKSFPETNKEERDNDWISSIIEKGCDLFGEAGNRVGARKLLQIQYLLNSDGSDDREEWVESELESLFDD